MCGWTKTQFTADLLYMRALWTKTQFTVDWHNSFATYFAMSREYCSM
jgi:hypothetical protein